MSKKFKRKSGRDKVQLQHKEDFDLEETSPQGQQPKYKLVLAYILDQDEVNRLIKASTDAYPQEPTKYLSVVYPTYSEEEANALMGNDYKLRKFRKKR